MGRRGGTRQGARLLAGVSVIALLIAVLPHTHGDSPATHLNQICRACKLHEAFSATPPVSSVSLELSILWEDIVLPAPSPRASALLSAAVPRAPPRFS